MTTALGEHEILIAVEITAKQPGQGMAYAKFAHPASRYAVVGAAAVVTVKDGVCGAARVTIGGLVPAATRAREVEKALTGSRVSPDAIAKAAGLVSKDVGPNGLGDIFASAEYRTAMAAVFVKRALTIAFERAV
jgi:carbon-monoxide dehydrogenase medium subunit